MSRVLGIEPRSSSQELLKIDLLPEDQERLQASLDLLKSHYWSEATKPAMIAKILDVLESVRPSLEQNAPAAMAAQGKHPSVLRAMDLLGQQIGHCRSWRIV